MADPQVSVLLPVHNGAATLDRALESLTRQTLSDWEAVVVDDGSDDATPGVLATWAGRDPRIRPMTLPRTGIVGALNAGLAACRGRYVARLDADDACHPERLKRQAHHLDSDPDLGLSACRVGFGGCREACAGYARYVDWTNSLLDSGRIALNRFIESPLAHPSVMFLADLPVRLGGYRHGDFPEDYELWLRWLETGVRMEKLADELVEWTDSPERLSRTDPRYAPGAFHRMKATYLARWLAGNNPRHPRLWVWGAGKVSRRNAAHLLEHGVKFQGFVDIDSRKIGQKVSGLPVIAREDIPGDAFVAVYVGSLGAREEIRDFLEKSGRVEGRDYILAA
ncbi:glycosyltransferase family 2 protein [Desulfohalovibrio reitneri]|uniref:glycosyltransferase family 2 protein n=1 Tax=Desulfohalovibrio reitneri TaxID=1307759 RepID=UPI0004A7130A|nr:glycosyltransferase family 2 protein [Desulfohalovibrio reitneri]